MCFNMYVREIVKERQRQTDINAMTDGVILADTWRERQRKGEKESMRFCVRARKSKRERGSERKNRDKQREISC